APATLRRLFAAMEADGRKRLGAFTGRISVRRSLDMRYGEQIFEIPVSLEGVDVARADLRDEIVARFHRRHEELYAYSAPGQEVVVVNARVAVVGELPPLVRALHGWGVREERAMKKLLTPVLAVSMLGLALTGCGTATGAAVGAGAGAAVGAGTGYGAGKGALIGAGVGGVAGAVYDITKK